MMVIVVALLLPIVSYAVGMTVWVILGDRKWQRCYNYAVEQAASRDVTDPKGQAYSDMATVLVMGRAPKREMGREVVEE